MKKYANKTLGSGGLIITPQTNKFKGVLMKKKPVNTGCDGVTPASTCPNVDYTDAGREPCGPEYSGTLEARDAITYATNISGNRNIAVLTYNFTTDAVSWSAIIPQVL